MFFSSSRQRSHWGRDIDKTPKQPNLFPKYETSFPPPLNRCLRCSNQQSTSVFPQIECTQRDPREKEPGKINPKSSDQPEGFLREAKILPLPVTKKTKKTTPAT